MQEYPNIYSKHILTTRIQVREVQGKRRLPVGTKVTFVLDRKDGKMRALRVVPLSKPEEILKLEEEEREARGETEEGEEEKKDEEKEDEEKDVKVSNRRWKRDDDRHNRPTSSLFHHKTSPKNSRTPGFRGDRSSRSPPFRPSSSSRTPPGFRTTSPSKWPYDPSMMNMTSLRRHHHGEHARNNQSHQNHHRHRNAGGAHHHNNKMYHRGGERRNLENGHHTPFSNLAKGPDGSKGFGGWRHR